MINLITGEITLCNSKFLINSLLKAEEIEKSIPELIIKKFDYGTGYYEYFLWGDFEENRYIYFALQFNPQNKLERIYIHPQHHGSIKAPQPYPTDCNTDWLEVKEWYHRYFQQKNERVEYPWGEIQFIRGSDPIYHPTEICVCYNSYSTDLSR